MRGGAYPTTGRRRGSVCHKTVERASGRLERTRFADLSEEKPQDLPSGRPKPLGCPLAAVLVARPDFYAASAGMRWPFSQSSIAEGNAEVYGQNFHFQFRKLDNTIRCV